MIGRPVILLLTAHFLGAGACRQPADGDLAVEAARVCKVKARVLCKKLDECTKGFAIARDFGSIDNCLADQEQICFESITRTGSGNSPAYAEACSVATERQSCDDRVAGPDPPECAYSKGQFAPGAVCISNNQCGNSYCDIPAAKECGKCAARRADGGSCDSPNDCLRGYYCKREIVMDVMAPTGVCARFVVDGQPCNDVLRCDAAASCSGFDRMNGVDGVCRKRTAAEGQACNVSDRRCLIGLSCVGIVYEKRVAIADGICASLVPTEGAACDRNLRTLADCDGRIGLFCFQVPMDAGMGTCRKIPFARVGESCGRLVTGPNEGLTVGCEAGRTCQRINDPNHNKPGICVEKSGDNQACNTDSNVGPGCGVGQSCVLKTPGNSTEGICRKRNFELICGI